MPAGEAPANKTKTKKLIIFGFFLINIQTGRAGSSASEGERRRRKKPQTKSSRLVLRSTFPFVSPPVFISYQRQDEFHINAHIFQVKSMATHIIFFFFEVLGWDSRGVKKKEADGKDRTEAKDRVRVGRKESKCDVGAKLLEFPCGHHAAQPVAPTRAGPVLECCVGIGF